MKQFKLTILFCALVGSTIIGQNAKLTIEANYGLQANFFVDDYDESPNAFSEVNFYQKSLVGTIGGIEAKYKIGKRSKLGIGYAGAVNNRVISYSGVINTVRIGISDFSITHRNRFFQLSYDYGLGKGTRSDVSIEGGLFYLRSNQQEVSISTSNRNVSFEERNFKNSRLEEGGVFFGFSYMARIDTKFRFGVRTRLYYLASTNSLEALTLTPTIAYTF